MSNYSQLLKDPRWQKKRLEIFELDHWKCRSCGSKTGTLHVHHLYYIKGAKPWEYENNVLITMCEECHSKTHDINWQRAFLDLNLPPRELLNIALAIKYMSIQMAELTKPVQEKFKTRFDPSFLAIESKLFESWEECDAALDYIRANRSKYNG